MSFPKVEYVTYESQALPSIGKVKFRPFIVGEHRRLLEAAQLGDAAAILETMVSIIDACCFQKVKVDTVEMYILDMLYLEIYMKSRGAVSPATYTCKHVVEKSNDGGEKFMAECGNQVKVNVPLDKAYLHIPEGYKESSVVFITPGVSGIKLRQPTMAEYKAIKANGGIVDVTDEFVYSSIDCIFDGDRVTKPNVDFTAEEFRAYMDTLPDEVMDQINRFFDDSPKLRLDLPIACPKCGHKETLHLEGLDDFFV
ncbi:baseplate hub assembly chaperone [Acidovorax phage ACP17]|uniref:Baseplate hub assembly chaperone n=1 Tax=Acidovorax phage ACP17 TaxID=2010329 RepID=A0A218M2Z1_9CAUD|nr:baseplate hub assembly chaperone [Acidovorax phage ACP17]ASD50409.1 baseplate hub assembly chaperone [Acidovorax phage ACP17]